MKRCTPRAPFRWKAVLDVKCDVGGICRVDEALLLVVSVEDLLVTGSCAKTRSACARVAVGDEEEGARASRRL